MVDDATVSVDPFALDAEVEKALVAAVSTEQQPTIFVLPKGIDGGAGIYTDFVITSAKELMAVGASARFLHDAEKRRFVGEYSTEIVATFAVGVASNVTVESVKALCAYVRAFAKRHGGSNGSARVRIARVEMSDGTKVKNLEITGIGEDVAQRIFSILMDRPEEG